MRKIINIKFQIGETIVLESDPDVRRKITGYLLREKSVMYLVKRPGLNEDENSFYDYEIIPCEKRFKVKGYRI